MSGSAHDTGCSRLIPERCGMASSLQAVIGAVANGIVAGVVAPLVTPLDDGDGADVLRDDGRGPLCLVLATARLARDRGASTPSESTAALRAAISAGPHRW